MCVLLKYFYRHSNSTGVSSVLDDQKKKTSEEQKVERNRRSAYIFGLLSTSVHVCGLELLLTMSSHRQQQPGF